MEVFQFKRFSVQNERSSMKVNTDGVLLGAAMPLRPSDCLLLDIGTGTGIIALMAAQRLAEVRAELESQIKGGMGFEDAATPDFKIIGIDIDEASAAEAAENFAMSPWASHLVSRHISLSEFEKECDDPQRTVVVSRDGEMVCTKKWYNSTDDENLEMCGEGGNDIQKFDVIFSNPPYFESSLKSPDERKRAARHADTLSYREVITFAARHLVSSGRLTSDPDCNECKHPTAFPSEAGRLSIILPYETEREAVRYAASFNLRLFRRLHIRTTPSRPLSRVILEFTFVAANESTNIENPDLRNEDKPAIINDELTIQDPADRTVDNPAGYTPAYRSLVKDFLLI